MVFYHKMNLIPFRKDNENRTLISRDNEIKALINQDLYEIIPTILFDREVILKDKIKACLMFVMKVFHDVKYNLGLVVKS